MRLAHLLGNSGSVYLTGGDVNEAPYLFPIVQYRTCDTLCSQNIGLKKKSIVVYGARYMSFCGKVNNCVHLRDEMFNDSLIPHISVDESKIPRFMYFLRNI